MNAPAGDPAAPETRTRRPGRPRTRSAVEVYGVPRLPSWLVPRDRLRTALDTGGPLTVVAGPAGGGKTMLLAQWAQTSVELAGRCAWVDVRTWSSSRAQFWTYVVDVLNDAGWSQRTRALREAAEHLRTSPDGPGVLHAGLRHVGPLTLIVDGGDLLEDAVVRDLTDLVTALPNLCVLVAARDGSRFVSPQVRLQLDVTVVSGADLALDQDEVAAFLGVSAEEAAHVRRTTGGLPAAVHALASSGDEEGANVALVALVRSTTSDLDADTMALLRRSATADTLTLALAAELTGSPSPELILEQVTHRGLGAWSTRGGERAFRYADVVRRVLRDDLRTAAPQQFVELRRAVAHFSAANGRPLEALDAAVDVDDLELASDILARNWYDLLTGHMVAVRELLSTVELGRLSQQPIAVLALALTENADRNRRRQAITLLTMAATAARAHRSRAGATEQVLLRLVELVALRLLGQRRALLRAAHALDRQIVELRVADRAALGWALPTVHSQTGLAYLYTGHLTEAVQQFQRGLSAAADGPAGLHNLACLAGTHAVVGEMNRAGELAQDARACPWPDGWIDGYEGAMHQLAEVLLAVEQLDVEAAQRHLDILERQGKTIEHWPLIVYTRAMVDLLAGTAASALERFEATLSRHAERRSGTPLRRQHLDATRLLLLVAHGQAAAALRTAPAELTHPPIAVAVARAQLVAGLADKALATLAGVVDRTAGLVRLRADHALLEAAAHAELGNDADAARALDHGVAVLEVHGLRSPLMFLRARDRRALLSIARSHDRPVAARLLADPAVPAVIPDPPSVPLLTPREHVVLDALTRTGSASDIAAELHVSPHTVKSQLRTLYRKLDANSRETALAAARRLGVLNADPAARTREPRTAPPSDLPAT